MAIKMEAAARSLYVKHSQQLDELEAQIDGVVEESFNGESVVITVRETYDDIMLEELQRRYEAAGWDFEYREWQDRGQAPGTRFTLTPDGDMEALYQKFRTEAQRPQKKKRATRRQG